MIYADYAYYTDTFYGEMLTDEDVFTKFAARASDYIDRITMNRARDYVVLHLQPQSSIICFPALEPGLHLKTERLPARV